MPVRYKASKFRSMRICIVEDYEGARKHVWQSRLDIFRIIWGVDIIIPFGFRKQENARNLRSTDVTIPQIAIERERDWGDCSLTVKESRTMAPNHSIKTQLISLSKTTRASCKIDVRQKHTQLYRISE